MKAKSTIQGAAEALQDNMTRMLIDTLNTARLRVAELEIEIRQIARERDELDRNNSALKEAFVDRLAAPHPFVRADAARISASLVRLSLSQRREIWLQTLSQAGTAGPLYALYPHDGGADPLTILVTGSGGFGDILGMTPILRELRRAFRCARVFVVHEHGAAAQVLTQSPYVEGVCSLGHDIIRDFVEVASVLDVFDLIADFRYAVTYTTPPFSRMPFSFLLAAHTRASEWQRYIVADWPHLNNSFAKEAARRKMGLYDLVGYTANLPINQSSSLDLAAEEPPEELARELAGKPYVTIHHGADPAMASERGLQTKNLPTGSFAQIVEGLVEQGFLVAQLGESDEAPVAGVTHDLRGRLSFRQAAGVIRYASAHVDTEGGLVHAARAMFTPAVVAFGPTSVPFFAYPVNRNFPPTRCGDCWWTSLDWSRRCPRGLEAPECMESHAPEKLVEAAIELGSISRVLAPVGERPRTANNAADLAPAPAVFLELGPEAPGATKGRACSEKDSLKLSVGHRERGEGLASAAPPGDFKEAPGDSLREPALPPLPDDYDGYACQSVGERVLRVAAKPDQNRRGLVVVSEAASVADIAKMCDSLNNCGFAVPANEWRAIEERYADHFDIVPVVGSQLGLETDSLDWIVVDWDDAVSGRLLKLLAEAGRCVRPEGRLWLRLYLSGSDVEADPARALAVLAKEFAAAAQTILGGRFRFDIAALGVALPRAPRLGNILEIPFTPAALPTELAAAAAGFAEHATAPVSFPSSPLYPALPGRSATRT